MKQYQGCNVRTYLGILRLSEVRASLCNGDSHLQDFLNRYEMTPFYISNQSRHEATNVIRSVRIPPTSLHPRGLGIALRLIQPPIQTNSTPSRQPRRHNDKRTPYQYQPPAEPVKRLLRPRPKVRAEPVADLADAVGDGDQRGLLAPRRGHDGRLPRELQVKAAVCPRDEEEEAKVARPDVDGRDEDGAPRGAGGDGQDYVPEGLLAPA